MADDKNEVGQRDRDRVAGGEDYEVNDFAEKHDLTPDQVRDLIAEHGNDRETLEAVIAKRNAE